MMWKLLFFSVIQSILLVGGQVLLKFSMMRMPAFSWSKSFWWGLLTNWQFALCGLFFGAASLLWMYIVKTFPFSMAYPMVSLSYVFGMFAAMFFFHEDISLIRWMGVAFIIVGCFLIVR